MPNDPCERCHLRPNSWFTEGGYICNACMDEWDVLDRYLLSLFIPFHRLPVAR